MPSSAFDALCAGVCGEIISGSPKSLPEGQRVCRPCRALRWERQPEVWPLRDISCAVCGESFQGRHSQAKYCSRKCKISHAPGCAPSRSLESLRVAREPQLRSCVVCSAAFETDRKRQRCHDCQRHGWVAKAVCPTCGSNFFAHRRQTYCTLACAPAGRTIAERPCIGCGTNVRGGPKTLCQACRETRRRVHDRHKRSGRRDIPRPERPLTLQELCERDNWRCHLCRKAVKSSLAWPHRMCATFDHLIPVVDGGSDEPGNLRLAHSRCNSSRGAGGVVQLILFG